MFPNKRSFAIVHRNCTCFFFFSLAWSAAASEICINYRNRTNLTSVLQQNKKKQNIWKQLKGKFYMTLLFFEIEQPQKSYGRICSVSGL